jgi:hypothetical protein
MKEMFFHHAETEAGRNGITLLTKHTRIIKPRALTINTQLLNNKKYTNKKLNESGRTNIKHCLLGSAKLKIVEKH